MSEKVHSVTFPFKKEGGGFGVREHTVSQEVYPEPWQGRVSTSSGRGYSGPVLAESETRQSTSCFFLELQSHGLAKPTNLRATNIHRYPVEGHSKKRREITMSIRNGYYWFH